MIFGFPNLSITSNSRGKAVWAAVIFLTGIKTSNLDKSSWMLRIATCPCSKARTSKKSTEIELQVFVEAGFLSILWVTWLALHTFGKDRTSLAVTVLVWPPVSPLDHFHIMSHCKVFIRMSIFDDYLTILKLWKDMLFPRWVPKIVEPSSPRRTCFTSLLTFC